MQRPDWVIIYGDTNSTIAGALAAKKIHIKVAHVVAGLRSFNMNMPEEINRILTDRISDILFCPTKTAVNNLKREGYEFINTQIVEVGDVMLDAAYFYSDKEQKPNIEMPETFVLATIHRAENTDNSDRMYSILKALVEISKSISIILPLHPRTASVIKKLNIPTANIRIIEPVGYLEMIYLLKNCSFVMTDSGGLQKEAFFFKKKCITLRDETEWVELVDAGYNTLVGANSSKIIEATKTINKPIDFDIYLYGKGRAAADILNYIIEY
jgi:UDP-GlcNAc3NAcA epimerase